MTDQPAAVIFTAEEKRAAIARELAYRRRVYPRWIDQGRMTLRLARTQISIFETIEADYATLETKERLL